MSNEAEKQVFGDGPADDGGQAEPKAPDGAAPAEPDEDPYKGGKVFGGETPDGEPAGEPEPEEDDAKKRAAFYQDRHQKTMETLRELDPSLYHAIREQYKEPGAGPEEPESGVVADDIDADFDPRKFMQKLDDLPKAIEKAAEKAQRDAVLRDRYAQETASVEQKLAGFVTENKIPDDDLKAALKEVQMLGIDTSQLGGPSAAARALVKELQYSAIMRHAQGNSTEAAAKAEAQAKATLLASQPDAGATPAPAQETEEEILLKKMIAAGSSNAANDVFGT